MTKEGNGVKEYAARAAHCDHRAPQAEVDETLRRITAPLARSWRRLEGARRIAIKFNAVWEPEHIRRVAGRRQELVDDAVLRAVLSLLRERTRAHLLVVDSTYHPEGPNAGYDVNFRPLLQEFGVEYVECSRQAMDWYEVPGGGLMFRRYQLNRCFRDVDALVSVAKLKSHAFMGVTLCTKNLFGLCPIHPQNRPRTYFHHLVRLPFVLADLGRLLQPCLNIVDALVGQSRREWGGEARVCNTLAAGDHCIATDACVASLMGHDPAADWPTPPFRRDRSHLRLAAEAGFGTVDLGNVDFTHDVQRPWLQFDSDPTDPREVVASWRRTTCEQALHFLSRRQHFVDRYAGEYIFLQDGEVIWHARDRQPDGSRRQLAGARKESAIWLKYVDPEEREGENFEVYARERERMGATRTDGEV
ncbi:MAG: DUF362 domain-containing protein [Planctomycetota bacterium]|nr:DUF362 domain-containing protein [Planctomycetota bacterium]